MTQSLSRRQFARNTAALSLSALLPRPFFSMAPPNTQEIVIHLDQEIGTVHPELHGQFAEHVGSCIYGGVWVGKDSPIPNINGYRKLVVEYLRDLGVPVIRWPGGCFADDYHWRDGVGKNRPNRVNLHWGDYLEDNSFGTNEFIGFCREIGTEPYLCGNVGSATPQELRDWMEYCNFPSGSTLSDERAANGSPEPFKVRYWGVGNENWGCGGAMTGGQYVNLFRQFAVFTASFGGTKPYLVACGPSRNNAVWSHDFMNGITRRRVPDGFAMHYYAEGGTPPLDYSAEAMAKQLATFPLIEQAVVDQRALLDGYHSGNKIDLIMDEWGVHDRLQPDQEKEHGRLWQGCTMRSALAVALGLNLFNRQADKLFMCNLAQMVNVRAPLLQTDGPEGKNCVRTTVYYVYAMFKPHRAKTAVHVEAQDPASSEFSASASRAGRELVISLVNAHDNDNIPVHCSLGSERAASATAQVLQSNDRNAFNGFDNPNQITPQALAVKVEGSSMQIDLPRLSVATVSVQLA